MARTVLLTGVTGFIAKHIARVLLDRGFLVLAALRNMDRAEEVRQALGRSDQLERLKFVQLDLLADDGWRDAMRGIESVIHTASPFPMTMPRDEDDLIAPAVDGTARVLAAAQNAGATRFVMTSSMGAMLCNDRPRGHLYGPDDWSDPAHPTSNAYAKSKTLAERTAWRWADQHSSMELTVINPGLVLGQPLDAHFGTSLALIDRLLTGRDPALPNVCVPLVDVRDVAEMHVAALETPSTIDRRFVAADRFEMLPVLARHLKAQFPDQPFPQRIAPKPLFRLLSLFDRTLHTVTPQIGRLLYLDNSETKRVFGMTFRPGLEAAEASVRFLINHRGEPSGD